MRDMTCQEIHSKLADHLPDDGKPLSVELAKHIAHCAACQRFATEQEDLAKNLRAVRECAGEVPKSLDAAVLTAFRRHVAERTRSNANVVRMFRPAIVWRWSVAVAIVLIAVVLFIARKKPASMVAAPRVTNPPANLVAQASTDGAPTSSASQPAKLAAVGPRHRHMPHHTGAAVSPGSTASSIPEEFRSLMYCDELSCPGEMDLVHVQLPLSAVARPVGLTRGNVVNADVIVGLDGIARGIRFEQ